MGIGPSLKCNKCGRTFAGGRNYKPGIKNYCHECLVPMADTISEERLNELGPTQKGFFSMVSKMGGLEASGGVEFWVNLLKKNAGEIEEIPVNTSDSAKYIMDMLERFKRDYKDSEGHSLLIGGLDSYIYPDKIQNIAQKYDFIKHKSFHIADQQLLDEVKLQIEKNRMVAIVAWTKENSVDMWLEP